MYAPQSVTLAAASAVVPLPPFRSTPPLPVTPQKVPTFVMVVDDDASRLTLPHAPWYKTMDCSSSPYTPACHDSCSRFVVTVRFAASTETKPEEVTLALTLGDADALALTLALTEGDAGDAITLPVALVESIVDILADADGDVD